MEKPTIKTLTEALQVFPDTHLVEPYEGEVFGLNIYDKQDNHVAFVEFDGLGGPKGSVYVHHNIRYV